MRNIILLLIILMIPLALFGQKKLNEPNIYFEHVYLPGSLHFNPINDFSQDSIGLLWIASNNGIFRYDGFEMTSSNNFNEFNSIKELPLTSVLAGSGNTIYASLKDGGILKFANNFSGVEFFNFISNDLPVNDLMLQSQHLIFLSNGKGIYKVDQANKKVIPVISEPVYSSYQKDELIAAGGEGKIFLIKDATLRKVIDLPQIKDEIRSIQLKNKTLYFNTREAIYKLTIGSSIPQKLFHFSDFNNATIRKVYNSMDDELWILTDLNGIYVNDKGNNLLHFEKNYFQKGALSNSRTITIFEDRYGILWVGTGSGINKYDKSKRYFSHLSHNPTDKNTLSGDIIRGVFEMDDERILIGTDDGVVNVIDSSRKFIKHIPLTPEGQVSTVIPYTFLQKDSSTEVYVGTSNGLYIINPDTKKIDTVMIPQHFSRRVREIQYYDREHIIGLSYGKVWKLHISSGKIEVYNDFPGDTHKLLKKYSRKLYIDPDKILYIGGEGLLGVVDPEKKTISTRNIATISSNGDTIKHMVLTLQRYEDKLYIGTYQGGLFILDVSQDPLHGKMICFTKDHGLPDNTVYSVIKDDEGYFWMSTNNGITRYNPETETFFNYDRNNGLQGEEFNRLAYAKSRRGEIIFGGIEGLNIFFPEKVHNNTSTLVNPVLTGVEIINHFDQEGEELHPRYDLLNTEKLEFAHNQNYLTFRFSSNNFSQTEKSRFYYKLENYDNNWIYSATPYATYTGLKPGKYVFKVKAIDSYGNKSLQEASIPFTITSQWWKNWWIGLFIGTAFFSFIAHSYRKNVRKNRAIKFFLEKEIERRTNELQRSKEELARLNAKKDFIFSILSHDLRSPLTTLKGFLGILVDHFDTLDENDIKLHAVNIKNSVAKSLDLLDNTLYWSLSQMGEIVYTPADVNLHLLFDKLHGLYDLTAKKKKVGLHFQLDKEISVFADENMTYITLRNLVSNAIKFTPAGRNVYVSAEVLENQVWIRIKDEGLGIKSTDIDKLFDQSQHYMEKGTSNEKGTGLGLSLCQKFTDMNNGTITVESKENKGSTFTVILPLFQPVGQPQENITLAHQSGSIPGQ